MLVINNYANKYFERLICTGFFEKTQKNKHAFKQKCVFIFFII